MFIDIRLKIEYLHVRYHVVMLYDPLGHLKIDFHCRGWFCWSWQLSWVSWKKDRFFVKIGQN